MKIRFTILTFLLLLINFAYGQKVGYKSEFESEQEIRNYLANNVALLDPLEGEYDTDSYGEYITPLVHQYYPHSKWKMFIVSNNGKFKVYGSVDNHFSKSKLDVEPIGDTNAYWMKFYSTSTRIYLQNNINFSATFKLDNASAKKYIKNPRLSPSVNVILYEDCVKTYPTAAMYANAAKKAIEESQPKEWTGTGFALTNNYIVTNNHVVDGAKSINVQGINGDFNHKYSAEVISTDKVNDLAIIKVKGVNIQSNSIPYAVKTGTSEVGEEVFVLGYPLTSTMGEEIKLTTGVVSSKTGFQGDVSIYQISAPIQPGNSGGPLFDSKGNIIGIVSAKHKGAENVGYAIKTTYLKNLMESVVSTNILPKTNKMASQNLSGKVKMAKNFVYYITCSSKSTNKSHTAVANSPDVPYKTPSKPNVNLGKLQEIAKQIISNMIDVTGGELTMNRAQDDSLVKIFIPSFSISKFEVTQEEWEAIMNTNPSLYVGNNRPVNNVSWNDCQEFIRRLNRLTNKNFRLPTEAEWEFAAKGGLKSHEYNYSGSNNIEDVAWYNKNSNRIMHNVGERAPNELGIYDMSGNMKEWCQDKIDNSQTKMFRWTPGFSCIARGGSWLGGAAECGVLIRTFISPEIRDGALGLRLVLQK